MKSYSSDAVTKTDLTAIDARQTEQIQKLRIALAACFAINLVVGIAAIVIALRY